MLEQFLLDSIIAGSGYSLLAVGFALIYRTSRFLHFGHGASFTVGPYLTWTAIHHMHLPLLPAVLFALAGLAALAAASALLIYRPIRKGRGGATPLFLASLGGFIVIQNVISLIFGDEVKSIRTGSVETGLSFFHAIATPAQLECLAVSVLISALVFAFLYATRLGRETRAVAVSPELSTIHGIKSERVVLLMFAGGAIMAGLAGIMKALDTDMTPTMGFQAVLMTILAVVAGGIDSIPGAWLGAYFVGFAQHFGVYFLPTQWQQSIVCTLLLLLVLLRPQGLLGIKRTIPGT